MLHPAQSLSHARQHQRSIDNLSNLHEKDHLTSPKSGRHSRENSNDPNENRLRVYQKNDSEEDDNPPGEDTTNNIPEPAAAAPQKDKPAASNNAAKPKKNPKKTFRDLLQMCWKIIDMRLLALDPDKSFRHIWNILMLAILSYNCISIPIRVCFGFHSIFPWILADIACDIVTLIDMFLNSITMYQQNGAKVREFRYTLWHYVKTYYFWFDLISIIPLDIFGYIPFITANFLPYPYWRLNRLARLVREKYYFKSLEDLVTRIKPTWFRLMRSIYFTVVAAHFIACAYFLIMDKQGREISSVTFIPGQVDLLSMDVFSQYIRCFYWAFVTMTGYSNTQPSTNLETAYSMVVSGLGLALYITIIGTVGSLISHLDAAHQVYISRMDQVNAFMQFRMLPSDLQEEIREYYTYLWKSRRSLDEGNVFSDLPQHLQIEVALKLNEKMIRRNTFFQTNDNRFIESIVLKLRPKLALPGSTIITQGEIGKEMYLINKGTLEVIVTVPNGSKIVVATLETGAVCGEIALVVETRRTATIRAVTHCDLFMLTKKDFSDICDQFPEEHIRIKEIAEERSKKTQQQQKKNDSKKKDAETKAASTTNK